MNLPYQLIESDSIYSKSTKANPLLSSLAEEFEGIVPRFVVRSQINVESSIHLTYLTGKNTLICKENVQGTEVFVLSSVKVF